MLIATGSSRTRRSKQSQHEYTFLFINRVLTCNIVLAGESFNHFRIRSLGHEEFKLRRNGGMLFSARVLSHTGCRHLP